ncbi:hypothetical protein FRB96_002380 [Tulasnella sp. 330]|nr:hypothetical protein FRB96_002380 [Tulasnella sp. 330]KAG8883104.1 hypothetical protein FRB97_007241 [Tulasnella sp. 331]KAG8886016.1 hypothetical protein FRB98_001492 [Tulasnella sp. 332]
MARTIDKRKGPSAKVQPEADLEEFDDGSDDYLGGPSTNLSYHQRSISNESGGREVKDEDNVSGEEGESEEEQEEDDGSVAQDEEDEERDAGTNKRKDVRVNGDAKGKARASPAPALTKSQSAQKKPTQRVSAVQISGDLSRGYPQKRIPNSATKQPSHGRSSAAASQDRTPRNAARHNGIPLTPPAIRKLKRELDNLRQAKDRAELRMEQEMQHLQDELDAVKEERDIFKKNFDELVRIRYTEAEAETRELEEIASARAATQDTLIQTLTAEIAGMEELSQNGHTHGLKLLTREATDTRLKDLHRALDRKEEEAQTLKKENADLKGEIAELQDSVQTLKSDLTQEKEHWTQEVARLSQRQPPYAATSSPRNNDRPNNLSKKIQRSDAAIDKATIQFFSDLSGCVLLKVTPGEGWDGHSNAPFTFKCLFTANETDALAFEITTYPPRPSPNDPDLVEEEVLYQPLLSETGPQPRPEFLKKLGFLSTAFTFQRNQLFVMGKTLLKQTQAGDDDGHDDDNGDDEAEESEMEVE